MDITPSASLLFLVVAFFIAGWSLVHWLRSPFQGIPYPPGPAGTLIAGNMKDVPPCRSWEAYSEWAKVYGDIIHLRLYNQHIVILNSEEEAVEMLEKRSNNYSDRPYMAMIDVMGWGFNAALMPYADRWRRHRKLYQQSFSPHASLSYRPVQAKKINDMLYGLLCTPKDFRDHHRTVTAATIMASMYGYDISAKGDYFVQIAEAAVEKIATAVAPGAYLVNAIPVLRYLPAWFPGAAFKRLGNEVKELCVQMQDVPLKFVKGNMDTSTAAPSLVATLLEEHRLRGGSQQDEDDIKEVAATSYAAAADTTVSALGTFFYAMALFPEAQMRAQKEIDHVIGGHRLPDFEDRVSLPYVEALLREVYRWKPVLPFGVPHGATDDGIYNGYFIPRGTTILPNIWGMSHNPAKYPQPEVFRPERFVTKDGELDKTHGVLVFGFGRRICPGRHMGDATLWLAIATVLATFDIRKAKDADGNEIPIVGDYTDSLISHPPSFECSILPRSDDARRLIVETRTATA